MIEARIAFQELRQRAGAAYDATELAADVAPTERRVARDRARQRGLRAVIGAVAAAGLWFAAANVPWGGGQAGPAHTPTAVPSASPSISALGLDLCLTSASLVVGKPTETIGGLEGWFNSTGTAPCDLSTEWDQLVMAHPDTILINTTDNTMMEAYYRTSIDALGAYANLGPDFVVPNPDPTWPADSLVLIDAKTGEVIFADPISDYSEDISDTAKDDATAGS